MTRPWHHTREAQAILADCAANPPAMKRRLAPLADWFAGGDEYIMCFDDNDDRVDALIRLSNKACEAAMLACGEDREALRRLIHSWPHVDHVIADALARARRAA